MTSEQAFSKVEKSIPWLTILAAGLSGLLLARFANVTLADIPLPFLLLLALAGLGAVTLLWRYPALGLYWIAIWNPLQYFFTKHLGWLPDWTIWLEDMVVYGLVGLALLKAIRRGGRVPQTWLEGWCILFLVLALFSTLVNQVPPVYFIAGLRSQLQFVLFFIAIIYLKFSDRVLKRFFLISLVAVLVQVPFAVYQFLQSGIGQYNPDSVFGTFALGYANIVGYYLLIFVFILIGLALELKQRRWLYGLFAVLLLIPIALTSSRAALFLLPAGMVALLGTKWLRLRVIVFAALFFVIAAGLVGLYYRHRLGSALNDLNPKNLVAEQLDNVRSPGRLRYLVITYELIQETPQTLLIGYGPGTYASTAGSGLRAPLLEKVTRDAYSPNIQSELVAVLGEYGFLGTFTLLGLYGTVMLLNYRNGQRQPAPFWRGIGKGMHAVSLIFLLGIFTERIWEIQPIPYYYWFFSAALFLTASQEAKHD